MFNNCTSPPQIFLIIHLWNPWIKETGIELTVIKIIKDSNHSAAVGVVSYLWHDAKYSDVIFWLDMENIKVVKRGKVMLGTIYEAHLIKKRYDKKKEESMKYL